MSLNVLNGFHMSWRNGPGRVLQGLSEVVQPGLQHSVYQHFPQARRHQRARVDQLVELGPGGQFHQAPDALERQSIEIYYWFEKDLLQNRLTQQRRQVQGEDRAFYRYPVLCMIIDKARGTNLGLVNR